MRTFAGSIGVNGRFSLVNVSYRRNGMDIRTFRPGVQ
jgi:hypothetical protein